MFHGVYRIAMDEGVLALLNGSAARILFHVPAVAITMGVLEVLKPRMERYL